MKLTYVGPKRQHTFNFPIPYISKGECAGEVIFARGQSKEVKDDWAMRLLEFCPQFFEELKPAPAKKG